MKKIEETMYHYIDEFGDVYSDFSGELKKLKCQIDSHTGYLKIRLSIGGIKRTYKIHRLVAMAFIPNPEDLPQVNHKDGDKLNNKVENLEWCTNQYNQQHAYDNDLNYKKIPGNISLTREQAKEIREKYSRGHTSHRKLAKEYGVSKTTIGDLLRERYYVFDL